MATTLSAAACGPGEFVQIRHIRVVDGDTLALWGRRVRLAGIDAPASLHARRERAIQRFRPMRSLQKFAAVHGSIHNHQERHLNSRQNFKQNRTAALAEWRLLCAG